jgi:exodeoxyribonuclease V alpha subunit
MLEGTVTDVVFKNAGNGYAILEIATDKGEVTVTGTLPGVSVGERLLLGGSWTTHATFGRQLKVETFEVKPPSGADEIYRYLSSGVVKDVGPAKARDIVARFAGDALRVIEDEPETLAEIRGISLKKARAISETVRQQASLRRLIVFLSRYGIKPLIALRAHRVLGGVALDAIRENPYMLAGEEYGAAFSEADAIAQDLGFGPDSPQRAAAALMFELKHNLGNGHVFIPKDKLIDATVKLIGAARVPVCEALDELAECGDVAVDAIAGVEACYLREMHDAEVYAGARLSEMTREEDPPTDLPTLILDIERSQGIKYADLQRQAIETAARGGVTVLTGGPGTGKTTAVRGILMLFDALGLKTALCAPTGRAAKRLSEMCGRGAATIHRMLGARIGADGALEFEHDESDPLPADAVIVDEASMIDIALMAALLSAMKRGSRLVLVGDADQLPPVGPGCVFADVIKSATVPVVALTEIFRQAKHSGIVRAAHSVNGGVVPDFFDKRDGEERPDIFFMQRQTDERLAATVTELYAKRLPEKMGIDPPRIQVLTPTRKNAAGTAMLNERLRAAVNPKHFSKKEAHSAGGLFREGDKVMQIRNNYDITWNSRDGLTLGTGVYNGDVGVITRIDKDRETVTVDFEDKLVAYLYDQLPELEPAFAMTVHKAQGSEYDCVVLALPDAARPLLTRGVLYTAISRAKRLLVIVGRQDVLETMVRSDKREKRYSGLCARLRGGCL